MSKRLFFDIETSPNLVFSWNVGRKLSIDYDNIVKERAIICICWKWENKDQVYSVKWDKGCDREAIRKFIQVANTADEIIAHNGDNFDIKWIRTRCIFHRIPMMPKYQTLDTLKKSRSGFRFNSNRLDYISKFLGFEGKIKTEFDLWKRVFNGEKKALDYMVEYCKEDVRQLESVYHELSSYITHNTHHGVHGDNEKYSCPECAGYKVYVVKKRVSAAGTVKMQMQCQDCGKYFSIPMKSYAEKLKDDRKWSKQGQ